jgi:hypothetical protein
LNTVYNQQLQRDQIAAILGRMQARRDKTRIEVPSVGEEEVAAWLKDKYDEQEQLKRQEAKRLQHERTLKM